MSIEKPVDSNSKNDRSVEEDMRIKRYIKLALFVFVAVFAWYALDLAEF